MQGSTNNFQVCIQKTHSCPLSHNNILVLQESDDEFDWGRSVCLNQSFSYFSENKKPDPLSCSWRNRGQQNPPPQNQNQQPHQQRQQASRTSSGSFHGKQGIADQGLVKLRALLEQKMTEVLGTELLTGPRTNTCL